MGLLEAIRNKRDQLKHAETVVTQADGRRFLEGPSEHREISGTTYGFVVDTKPDNVPAEVSEYLYLGSQDCCEVLEKYKISHVLSVGIEPPCKVAKVTYKFVPCLDLPETDIVSVIKEYCIPFITDCVENKTNLLVHCNAGVSRSSAVVIGYFIIVKGFDYDVAFNIVKNARPCIKPNRGFEEQLRLLMK